MAAVGRGVDALMKRLFQKVLGVFSMFNVCALILHVTAGPLKASHSWTTAIASMTKIK
jgi:hypothetical protein